MWLLQLKYVAQDAPEAPAIDHFDEQMVGVMAAYLSQAATRPKVKDARRIKAEDATSRKVKDARRLKAEEATGLKVKDFWRGIGLLGGHMGRKSDGKIGWLRAWRGWQAFQLILLGAGLAEEQP